MRRGETILRNTILGLTGLAVLLAITLGACDLLDPSPNATVTEPPPIEDECRDVSSLMTGAGIYRCECASCHGLEGVPITTQVKNIRGFSDQQKFEVSLNIGPLSMPAFPQLDSTQRQVLFEYCRDTLGM